MRLQVEQCRTRADLHFHRRFGRVAQRDLRPELVVFAHQRRQAADDLQVLRRLDRRLARTEKAGRSICDGDDAEGGQCIVERHGHYRLALGVELHFGVP